MIKFTDNLIWKCTFWHRVFYKNIANAIKSWNFDKSLHNYITPPTLQYCSDHLREVSLAMTQLCFHEIVKHLQIFRYHLCSRQTNTKVRFSKKDKLIFIVRVLLFVLIILLLLFRFIFILFVLLFLLLFSRLPSPLLLWQQINMRLKHLAGSH